MQNAASLALAANPSIASAAGLLPQVSAQPAPPSVVPEPLTPLEYRYLRFSLSYSADAGQLFVRYRDPASGAVLLQLPTSAPRPDVRTTNSLVDTPLADFEGPQTRTQRPESIPAAATPEPSTPAPAPVSVNAGTSVLSLGGALDTRA
ncbi:MAG: hypothetical protein SF002_09895 [Alphaproteobacteria bacterium]|nr:hypothetical protein [Alphaproteobacteria bacterium]